MVNANIRNGGGASRPPAAKGGDRAAAGRGTPFVLKNEDNGVQFAPRYFPETLRRTKERDLNRKDQFCEGENVTDQGGKNWNLHIVGRLLTNEMKFFDRLAEEGDKLLLTSLSWSGEVLIEEAELDGPVAWDPQADQYHWTYTLNVVSTGRDERGEQLPDGIIDDGSDDTTGGGGGAQLS